MLQWVNVEKYTSALNYGDTCADDELHVFNLYKRKLTNSIVDCVYNGERRYVVIGECNPLLGVCDCCTMQDEITYIYRYAPIDANAIVAMLDNEQTNVIEYLCSGK